MAKDSVRLSYKQREVFRRWNVTEHKPKRFCRPCRDTEVLLYVTLRQP